MKKILIAGSIATLLGPAHATCTVSGVGLGGSCEENTTTCKGNSCTTTYTYKAAGTQVCKCTGKCKDETFPAGWNAITCHCIKEER